MINETDEFRSHEFTKQFEKQFDRLPLEIKKAFRDAFELFLEDPNNKILRNHPLQRRLAGYRSIDVMPMTDYRALFKEKMEGKRRVIKFHQIGRKKKLYRNASK